LAVQKAALDQAQVDLDRTVLRAPIDGVVIKQDVNPGQTVAVSLDAKTLFKIANDLREMEVHGKIDEADVGQLKVGQTAEFTVDPIRIRPSGETFCRSASPPR
jgi:HlyD family secretion protein